MNPLLRHHRSIDTGCFAPPRRSCRSHPEVLSTDGPAPPAWPTRTFADSEAVDSPHRPRSAVRGRRVGSWHCDFRDRIRGSQAAWEILGHPPRESITLQESLAVVHPDDRAAVRDALEMTTRGDRVLDLQCRIVRPDGEVRWVEICGDATRDATGALLSLDGVIVDITDRKSSAALFRADEERLRLAVEANRMVAWEWDPRTDQITATANFADIYGLPALAGAADGMALVWPEDFPAHQEKVFRVARKGGEYHSRFRITRPVDGQTAWLEERAAALTDDSGQVTRLVGVVTDITARAEAEKRATRLRALAASLNQVATPTEVSRVALEAVGALGAQGGALYLYEGDRLELVDASGLAPDVLDRSRRVPLSAANPVSEAVRQAEPIFLPSRDDYAQRYPHHVAQLDHLAAEAAAILPLRSNGRVLGALDLVFARPLPFDAAQQRFLLIIGDLIAQALDRSRLFAAAKAAEADFRLLADAMPQLVWVTEADGSLSFVNARWTAFTGLDLAASNDPLEVGAVYHPDDRQRVETAWSEAVATRSPLQVETRMRGQDGADHWFLLRATPVQGSTAGGMRWFGTATDITEDKERAIQAAAANERFARAETAAGAFSYEWDLGLDRVERSAGLRSVLGYGPEELAPTWEAWNALMHRDDVKYTKEEARAFLSTFPGDYLGNEYRVRHRNGAYHWLSERTFLIRDPTGRVQRIVGQTVDITERRRAQAALAESEERFRMMADHTPVMIWTTDAAGEIEFVNHAYGEFFGVTEAEVRGPDWQPLVHPDDRADYVDAFFSALREGQTFHAKARLRRKDGAWRWIEAFGAPRHNADGEVLGMVGSSLDITEREESDTRFRNLFANAADAMLIADAEANYLDANPAAMALLGYDRDELLALTVADIVARSPTWAAEEYARYKDEGYWRGELELRRKDGTTVPVEAIATVIALPSGEMYLSTMRDISDRTRAESERTAFLDAVAHDVKNPLGAAKGQAQLQLRRLRRGDFDPVKVEASLAGIETAINRATALMNELLDTAHLRAGRLLELQLAPVDLVALARSCAEEAPRGSANHVVRVETDADAIIGEWDEDRLSRVLHNLLSNAVKYSPEGGDVVVQVTRERDVAGNWAVLSVSDQGIGIPATDLTHVFDRFHRAKNVVGIAGSGIGLAGAKQIVEQLGGTIAVASEEGVGSLFTVRLPLGDVKADTSP